MLSTPISFPTKHLNVTADLLNIFETFLPQLLLYPNPTDPLNGEAAALLMREPEAYTTKVKGGLKGPPHSLKALDGTTSCHIISKIMFWCQPMLQLLGMMVLGCITTNRKCILSPDNGLAFV